MVRAAAFRITPGVRPGELPFCGTALAAQIGDLAASGTTRQLREHECAAQTLQGFTTLNCGLLNWLPVAACASCMRTSVSPASA